MANVVTLDEVRAHLRYPIADTQDDALLQLHIDAADDALRKECGELVPQTYDELYDGGDVSIFLLHRPVLSVASVEEGWGTQNFILDFVPPNNLSLGSLYAYSVDNDESGQITRRTAGNIATRFVPGNYNIRVTYTAGRQPIPPLIKLAELELISWWWRNTEERAANAQTGTFGAVDIEIPKSGAAMYTSINQGIPWGIIEMLKAYRTDPIIG